MGEGRACPTLDHPIAGIMEDALKLLIRPNTRNVIIALCWVRVIVACWSKCSQPEPEDADHGPRQNRFPYNRDDTKQEWKGHGVLPIWSYRSGVAC